MQTIVELPNFLQDAESILTEKEREELIEQLAKNPTAGVVMQGTGGVRKIRWGAKGKGKRGGSRTIYYHHDETMPIFMIAIFGKNEKINLTQQEIRQVAKAAKALKDKYGGKS